MKASTTVTAVGKNIMLEYPTTGLVICSVLRNIPSMTSAFVVMENLIGLLKVVYVHTTPKQQR